MDDKIVIIGGGISGLTTGITLQLSGFETQIYAEKTVQQISDKNEHPTFASLFPSASVIPHSVYSDQLKALFQLSQSFFYELRKQAFPGVTIHKHFEVFEFDPERPEYCNWMLNFEEVKNIEPEAVPRRPGIGELYGWAFNCIFADWEWYLPAIEKLYQKSGGSIIQQKLQEISDLPAKTIINCSGTGSPQLFDDPVNNQLLMQGHILHKADAPLITNADGAIVSYNYTPKASVYADAAGEPCDVYCYPRQDGWILGGSRQECRLNDTDGIEKKMRSKNYEADGISFPRPIIDLNNEILNTTYGLSVDNNDRLSPSGGYRYIRSRENGLRLEREEVDGKKIFHNYGHGGAGVTLSWGCALKIVNKFTEQDIEKLASSVSEKISKKF